MRNQRGFSLIDVLIGAALMVVLFVGLLGLLRVTTLLARATNEKGAMIGIANARMEYLRGIAYDALGTIDAYPSGTIEPDTTETVDGVEYEVRTQIGYGESESYKTGSVTVLSPDAEGRTVSLTSDFMP